MRPVHYIISVYTGKRANFHLTSCLTQDSLYLVKMHIKTLSMFKMEHIQKVTFVVSPCGIPSRDDSILEFIDSQKHNYNNIDIDAFISENNDFWSYGAWNSCMMKHLDGNRNFFLIEDDYFPACDEFYIPFYEKLTPKIAYVSQIYTGCRDNKIKNATKEHASMSGGIINFDAAKKHYETYGTCVYLPQDGTKSGVFAQLHFLDNFKKLGYDIEDLYSEYQHPYSDYRNRVNNHGNLSGKILLNPYINCLNFLT